MTRQASLFELSGCTRGVTGQLAVAGEHAEPAALLHDHVRLECIGDRDKKCAGRVFHDRIRRGRMEAASFVRSQSIAHGAQLFHQAPNGRSLGHRSASFFLHPLGHSHGPRPRQVPGSPEQPLTESWRWAVTGGCVKREMMGRTFADRKAFLVFPGCGLVQIDAIIYLSVVVKFTPPSSRRPTASSRPADLMVSLIGGFSTSALRVVSVTVNAEAV
jgi:hypothetical protein